MQTQNVGSKLLTPRGSTRVTRDQLKQILIPPKTRTFTPVAHYDLIDMIDASLNKHHIQIAREDIAVQRDGNFLFAALDLKSKSPDPRNGEFIASMGLRAANNKAMSIQIIVGARVIVCDNLMFSGDVIALKKRHSGSLQIVKELDEAVMKFQDKFTSVESNIAKMRSIMLEDRDAKQIIFDVFKSRVLPIRLFNPVSEEYMHPTFEGRGKDLWSLNNAMTHAAKLLPDAVKYSALTKVGRVFNALVA